MHFQDFIQRHPQARALNQQYTEMFHSLSELTPLEGSLSTSELYQNVSGHYADMHQRNNVVMHFYPKIDTRLFTAKWRHAYAVFGKKQHSLHFFDRYGRQSYQVSAKDSAVLDDFESRLKPYVIKNAPLAKALSFAPAKAAPKYEKDIDTATLRDEWRAMTNVHQAGRIFKQHGNDTLAVYRALGEEFAIQVDTSLLPDTFNQIKQNALDLMYFVRNNTAVQCFAGQLGDVESTETSLTLSGERLDSNIQLDALGETWLVKKPTDAGWIHSLSIFNPEGENVITLTDFRNRSTPEKTEWLTTLLNVYPDISWR